MAKEKEKQDTLSSSRSADVCENRSRSCSDELTAGSKVHGTAQYYEKKQTCHSRIKSPTIFFIFFLITARVPLDERREEQ